MLVFNCTLQHLVSCSTQSCWFYFAFSAFGELQHIMILIFHSHLEHLASSFPLILLRSRKPIQNNNSILHPTRNRLTIASQLPPTRFTILKGTGRLHFRNQFTTQARFYIQLTIGSQSPHNCLVYVCFECGVLGSPLKFLSKIQLLLYANQ